MKKILRYLNLKFQIRTRLTLFQESLNFYKLLNKYNASVSTDKDIKKMQYTILRENHVIEKGMSMRNPRKGFGQAKVIALLKRLCLYVERYGNDDIEFVIDPLSTIKKYIDYTNSNGVCIDEIEASFNDVVKKTKIKEIYPQGGIMEVFKEDIQQKGQGNFSELLYSRHSVRYFKDEDVTKEIVEKALTLAQRTPSACNRQAWLTHVYLNDKSKELLMWQGGCKGFEDEIRCSILVTANLKGFLSYEPHQAYIDGGMYAMNLLNAFHSIGMATIPLSCGFTCSKLSELQKFNIAESEVPIVIIGVGYPLDKYNVAISLRKDISETNFFH